MSYSFDVARELEGLADALTAPAWLHDQIRTLTEAEAAERLAWLHREARAGREHALCGFLGPETFVTVRAGEILVRQYPGVAVEGV